MGPISTLFHPHGAPESSSRFRASPGGFLGLLGGTRCSLRISTSATTAESGIKTSNAPSGLRTKPSVTCTSGSAWQPMQQAPLLYGPSGSWPYPPGVPDYIGGGAGHDQWQPRPACMPIRRTARQLCRLGQSGSGDGDRGRGTPRHKHKPTESAQKSAGASALEAARPAAHKT